MRTSGFLEFPHQAHVMKGQSTGSVEVWPLMTKKDATAPEVWCTVLGTSSQATHRGPRQALAAEAQHERNGRSMNFSCGGPF